MSLLHYYSGQCMTRVKECNSRMGSREILKYLGTSLGKSLTRAVSLVLLQTFTSPSGDIWCSSCCGKRRLRLCNESVRALVQHKANCCQPAVCQRLGHRGYLTTEGANNLLEGREREMPFGGREAEEDIEL